MRKSLILLLILMMVSGCAAIGIRSSRPPCTICETYLPGEPSLICERITDPCEASRLLSISVQGGAVWDAYTIDEAIAFLENDLKPKLSVDWSYNMLKIFLLAEVSKFNKKAGGTFFLLTGYTASLDSDEKLYPKDVGLANMGVDKIIKELKDLRLFMS